MFGQLVHNKVQVNNELVLELWSDHKFVCQKYNKLLFSWTKTVGDLPSRVDEVLGNLEFMVVFLNCLLPVQLVSTVI